VLRPYAADTLARFLGGTYVKPTREGLAQNSVLAALGILEMEERKVEGFSERVLRNNNDEGEKYLGAKKVIKIISDIKAKEIKITERREKTAEEIAKYNAEQLRLAQEEKAREKEAKEIKEALVRQIADANREEDEKKERALKAKLDAEKKKAEETAADFKVKRKALDIKVEDIKEAETHARKEDAYAPIRRDIESVLRKVEGTTACSRASLEEEAKVLRRKAMHVEDRERLRQAALNVGNWYKETLASMFLPPMSAKQELTESKQREETKRRTAKRREK
jgi:colicin import membrane protein